MAGMADTWLSQPEARSKGQGGYERWYDGDWSLRAVHGVAPHPPLGRRLPVQDGQCAQDGQDGQDGHSIRNMVSRRESKDVGGPSSVNDAFLFLRGRAAIVESGGLVGSAKRKTKR